MLPSEFEKNRNKGFGFGIGRDAYSKVFVKEAPAFGKEAPGPGTYELSQYGKKSPPQFSIRGRTADSGLNPSIKINPGPGQYPLPTAIDPKGKHMYAKYKNSAATLFSPPSSVRFKSLSKIIRRLIIRK